MRPRRFRIGTLLQAIGAVAILLTAVHGTDPTQKWVRALREEGQLRRTAAFYETRRPNWAAWIRAEAAAKARAVARLRPDPIVLGCQALTVVGLGMAPILFLLRMLRLAIRAAVRPRSAAARTAPSG
jgi:hypothetical protein